MALAHGVENRVEVACRRGDLFAKRRQMMQAWADYLKKPKTGAKHLLVATRLILPFWQAAGKKPDKHPGEENGLDHDSRWTYNKQVCLV